MSKKQNVVVESKGIISEAFQNVEGLSIRKIAEATNANYNMLLKSGKEPIKGQVYDPNLLNYNAIEVYLRKHVEGFDELDWAEIAQQSVTVRLPKEAKEWDVNDRIKIRQDERAYTILIKTETHVVIMADNDTQPRVFSLPTFAHQCPKKIAQ